ncbi:MAG: glycosyltransferase [Paludibacter sp.]
MKNDSMPLVTVIAACYNQAKYLVETLDSIASQTYSNKELIIWDDASIDNSVELIENWISSNNIHCIFIKHAENKGICKSLNEAFQHAKGKYIQVIAMDDILLPDKLENQVNLLESSSENEVLVFSDAFLIDSSGSLFQNKFIALHRNYLSLETSNYYDDIKHSNFIPAPSVLYKSDAIRNIGGWDDNLLYEDFDMLLRLSKSCSFIFDPTPQVKYRIHSNNTIQYLGFNKSDILIYSKFIDDIFFRKKIHNYIKMCYSQYGRVSNEYRMIYKNSLDEFSLMYMCIVLKLPFWVYRRLKRIIEVFI